MGKKPKAPDMSWQVEAAKKQEEQIQKQQKEIDIKNEQLAISNTEKLRNLRRRSSGPSFLEPTQGATPQSINPDEILQQEFGNYPSLAKGRGKFKGMISPQTYEQRRNELIKLK